MRSSALRHPARLAGASLLRMQSDARLTELALAGHEAAFDAIVDRYRTPLMRYCAGIVGPSRAEDAVQQTLINAHEAMTRTGEVRHLKSWLYRIAHNAALNVLRAVKDDVPLDEAALGARVAGPGDRGPAESFERSEQFRETLAALQALPERQRAALVLRELEGRSHEEIAAALGVTKGSARQHLMRGRAAVRSAVTAITPYPLVARLAEMLSGGGSAGWVDAAAGAGASATLMKLGAGVAATGALVGGAVGTQHVVRGGSGDAAAVHRSAERAAQTPAPATRQVVTRDVVTRATVQRSSSSPPAAVPRREKTRSSSPGTASEHRSAPAATPETTHHGRRPAQADHGRSENAEQHHRGSDQRSTSSGHGRAEDNGRHGSKQPKRSDAAKPKASAPPRPSSKKGKDRGKGNGKGKSNGKAKADDHGSAPASNGSSSSSAEGSDSDHSGAKPAKPSQSASEQTTTAVPPTAASGDD